MKLLFDENIGKKVYEFFKSKDFNVLWAGEDFKGYKDKDLLEIAKDSQRIFVTMDKDFADLVFKDRLKSNTVILLRLSDISQNKIILVLDNIFANYKDKLKKAFIVVSDKFIRVRKL